MSENKALLRIDGERAGGSGLLFVRRDDVIGIQQGGDKVYVYWGRGRGAEFSFADTARAKYAANLFGALVNGGAT